MSRLATIGSSKKKLSTIESRQNPHRLIKHSLSGKSKKKVMLGINVALIPTKLKTYTLHTNSL